MNHFTIVTARGQQHFTTSGRFIEGANGKTSARTASAARLAVFTLAAEADAQIVKGMRWAASMIFYMLKIIKPTPVAPATQIVSDWRAAILETGRTTANQRMQAQMCADEGTSDYRAAWQAKMDRYVAAHPNPQTQPAPQPQRFQQAGPQVNSLSA